MIPAAGAADPHWWNDAEPIWITAEKNNKKSALYWWAGCEVEIKGAHPTICERQYYDGPPIKEVTTDFQERIDDFIEMFKYSKRFEDDRLSLVLMYYSSVDFNGHYNGPKSSDVKKALQDVDEILYKMQQKIREAHLQYDVNIMVVSDHGMTDTRANVVRHIDLKKYAPSIKHQMDYGGFSAIIPQPGMLNKLVQEISADKIEGLRIYKKEDLPEKYHLKGSSKTAPLILIAKQGYYIDRLGDPQKVSNGDKFVGHHGYDPEEVEDMRTIFLATGPDFKKGTKTDVLHITDIYNVMCTILNIPALPNNGSWDRAKSMLVDRENNFPIVDGGVSVTANSCCFLCVMLVTTCILMYSGVIFGL
ncbi:hypothetical protein TNIN_451601 [Trichonephila inaurata madagascariensis]|uniref:glycerophosphocholine cholinephosphodiesterase n=2 Tax=Trichonephila inaurata madagascariensis TaxID=2747483 RepID=A0A8X6X1V0_9ARAC|nr:hypothetical protein TNIN_451601 [Trichonephila inaurata madagascariensis]